MLMSSQVAPNQRWTRNNPCPICGGWPGSNPGCKGYASDNPDYCYCTNSALGGSQARGSQGQYSHKLTGQCKCGATHGAATPIRQREIKRTLDESFNYGEGCWVDRFALDIVDDRGKPRKDHVQYHLLQDGTKEYKGFKKLYRLDELLATDPRTPCWIAEGERKVNKLWEMGIPATCNVGGSGGWLDEYAEKFKGRTVFIWPDNDVPGTKFASQVSESLNRAGVKNYIANKLTVGLPETGDVLDWLKIPGNDKDRLKAIEAEYLPRKLLWSLKELANYPRPVWLIPNIIKVNSLAFLVGPPKCGKSFYGLDLACQVAMSGQRVAYIGAEDPGDFYVRAMAWASYHKVDPEVLSNNLVFWVEPIQLQDDTRRNDFLSQIGGVALIVVDTLAMNSFGLDENSSQDMGIFVNALLDLKNRTRACVLTIHHTNRLGAYRGSSVLPAAADTFILASQEGDKLWNGGQLKVVCEFQKSGVPFPTKFLRAERVADTLILVDTNLSVTPIEVSVLTPLEREILSVCARPEAVGGLTVTEIIRYAGWSKEDESKRTNSYRACSQLADKMYLTVVRAKRRVEYNITQKGIDAVIQGTLQLRSPDYV